MNEKLIGRKNEIPTTRNTLHARRQRQQRLRILIGVVAATFLLYNVQKWSSERHGQTIISNHIDSHQNIGHGGHLFGKEAENLFLSIPDETSAMAASRRFATKPHIAGSPGDLTTAKDFLAILQEEFGIPPPSHIPIYAAGSSESQEATLSISQLHKPSAWIDTYYPVINTPLDRSIQVIGDDGEVLWEADLAEYSDEADHEANKYANAVPTFHGLSPAGDVKGKLVDGNYCRKEDYDALAIQKIDVKGSIIMCRYGGIFRGLKVKGGQEVGAAAVLIYSDPRDDGTVTEENGYAAYPHGPARNPTSVQRGSVQFISLYPGDPTTPGYPSYENSTRTEGENIPSIASIPVSWANAQQLFKTLTKGGHWEGKQVRVVNNVDNKVTPIWNTLGVIPGYIKDEVIMIGNHRDAWVLGATDPSSGTASVHEVIRGLGALMKKGWKPLRTIIIASWDAEEYGLIGSTEWGEDFFEWIDKHVVAYLNLDSSTSGSRLGASASPLLAHFVRGTAEEIPHPTDHDRTLWDATKDNGTLFGQRTDGKFVFDAEAAAVRETEISTADSVGVNTLGSGSDYTVFLQRIGIPSTNGGFGATIHDPVYHYHSIFDSPLWQEKYGDPGFFRHVAVAKHLGLQILRLSNSIVYPFNTTHYTYELRAYLERVEKIASDLSLDIDLSDLSHSVTSLQAASVNLDLEKAKAEQELRDLMKEINKRRSKFRKISRRLYCRLKKIFGHECKHPKNDDVSSSFIHRCEGMKHLRVGRLPAWIHEQEEHAYNAVAYGIASHLGYIGIFSEFEEFFTRSRQFPLRKLRKAIKRVQTVNKKLASFERGFISVEGIKDREWFRHLGVAPGKWLGYGATTFPGLTESLTFDKNITLAKYEAGRLIHLIDTLTQTIHV